MTDDLDDLEEVAAPPIDPEPVPGAETLPDDVKNGDAEAADEALLPKEDA
jgi:hypothetical protein